MPDYPGWFAAIYTNGSHDPVGSVRRSKRLHWTMKEARQEMEGWVCQLGLGKIAWDTVADDVIVASLPSYIAAISNIYLPVGDPPTLNGTDNAILSRPTTRAVSRYRRSDIRSRRGRALDVGDSDEVEPRPRR